MPQSTRHYATEKNKTALNTSRGCHHVYQRAKRRKKTDLEDHRYHAVQKEQKTNTPKKHSARAPRTLVSCSW